MSNRRIVLDANVLIDAIFVPGSFSYKLLFTPAGNAVHSSFIICKSVVDETERRLKAAEPKVGIQPRNFLADVLRLRGYVIVDALSVGRSRNVGINRADSYVVDDALALNADICTKDIGDIGGASVLGIRVFTPRDLLGVGLHTLSGGFYAGRASGTWIFFGSFSQPFSPAAGETSKRYLADLPGVGGLFIDSAKGEICFALDWGPAVSLKIPPNATDISLCVTYRANAKLTIQYGVNGPESNISIGHPAPECC